MIWWLSFVDPDDPDENGDGAFVGVCMVEADSMPEAVAIAWAKECNPGGDVMGMPFPLWPGESVPMYLRDTLWRGEAARLVAVHEWNEWPTEEELRERQPEPPG